MSTVSVNEKICRRKTIVLQTLVDPAVIKVAGEKLKNTPFALFGFLKPNPKEIQLVSIEKYYEPYIVTSGKYTIDYYRGCLYTVSVPENVDEVILLEKTLQPKRTKSYKEVVLDGEERLKNVCEVSLILDKHGKEFRLEKIPYAPSEKHPKKLLSKLGKKAKQLEIAPDSEVDIIRRKVVERPPDIKRIVHELLEVTERTIIYTPRYKVTVKRVSTGEVKTLEFDGVTSKMIQRKRTPGLSYAILLDQERTIAHQ